MDAKTILIIVIVLTLIYSATAPIIKNKNYELAYALLAIAGILGFGLYVLNLSTEELGLTDYVNGALHGVAASLLVGAVIALASRLPFTRNHFEDERILGQKPGQIARKTLVDIPIAVVLIEELLFRGLLLGLLLSITSEISAVLISSVLFGLWHVLPAVAFAKARKTIKAKELSGTILGTVLFTSAAGVVFAFLRLESGSILAPIILHYVVNTTSYFASWRVTNSA